ncbi:MAG: zinc ABC transporter solute-binding protein, partial [Desertifilum sp. SIO1I2]|nr:zinc ABC transporter solute-binding protein [Desertifilum sp. SIO1I2]
AGRDPHTYSPTPSDRTAIENADLVLYGGYDYEPGIIRLIQATSNASPKVAVFEQAVPQPLMGHHHHHDEESHDHAHDQDRDHAHDQDHAEGELVPDPHVWHNPQNGIQMVAIVQQQLSEISPDNAQQFAQNAEALKGELSQIDSWIQSQIATIPQNQRKLVTTHDALTYFSEAYNIPVAALQGVSTEARPTAAGVRNLTETIRETGVPTIFVENTTNPEVIETVAREANVQVSEQPLFVEGPGGSGSGAETYPQMLIANTRTIVQGLGGQYASFAGN